MGFEYSVSAIGAVIMQDAINLLGSTAVAAQTAGEKIRQMFTLPMESVGMAMATYVGRTTAHTVPTASGRASRTAAWCSCSTAPWRGA